MTQLFFICSLLERNKNKYKGHFYASELEYLKMNGCSFFNEGADYVDRNGRGNKEGKMMHCIAFPYIKEKVEVPFYIKQMYMSNAINMGNVNLLRAVIDILGASVNLDMEHGMRPILLAAWNFKNDIISELLKDSQIDVNAHIDWNGYTALHCAACHCNKEGVRMLLAHPTINPDALDADGNIPLSRAAASFGPKRVSVFRMLLERTKDVNSKNKYGETPIYRAAWHGHADLIEIMLQCPGIDENLPTNSGRTPLHIASACGKKSAVAALLKSNSINAIARDGNGDTPWVVADREGYHEIAKMIAEHINLK